MSILAAALELYDAGLTVIPVALDGSKSPHVNAGKWRAFIDKRPTRKQVEKMFRDPCGVAVLGGNPSGGLEIIDFDKRDALGEWQEIVATLDPSLLQRLPLVMTPGGWHVYFRSASADGNKKLAMEVDADGKLKTKIETRGHGGYVIAPGSPRETHPTCQLYTWQSYAPPFTAIPTLSADERKTLIDAARSLNTVAEQEDAPRTPAAVAKPGEERPGDDFESKTTWDEILKPHGWSAVRRRGDVTHWRRPGKDDKGISATTGFTGDKLYVFSSNAAPFDPGRVFSKFTAYGRLNHGGDFASAARDLRAKGFGAKREPMHRPSERTFTELSTRLDAMTPPHLLGAPPDAVPLPLDDDAPLDTTPAPTHRLTAEQLEAMLDDDPAAFMRPGIFERVIAMRSDRAEWLLIGDVLRRKKKKADFTKAVKDYDAAQKRGVARDGWKSALLYRENKDGDQFLDKCLANLIVILSSDDAWSGVLALDEFSNQIVCRRTPPIKRTSGARWSDADVAETKAWIERAHGIRPSTGDVNDAIIVVCRRQAFSSLRDYFDALPEARDGESMIDTWLMDFFGAKDTPYVRAVGAKWLISAVARAYSPGAKVDTVLILEGKQGLRKSSVLEKLCPSREWFADGLSEFGSRAQAEEIEGKWIVELAEMSGFKRVEIEQIKSFVSRTAENYRPAYGRHVINSPRKCVFAATVNPGGDGYLKDETGNRRFWPVKCERIAAELTPAIRDALWSEAKARYLAGERWYFDADSEQALIEEANAEQQQRVVSDPWQELVEDELLGEQETSVNEILGKIGVEKAKRTGGESVRVGRILTLLGWERRYKHTSPRGWRYFKPTPQLKLAS